STSKDFEVQARSHLATHSRRFPGWSSNISENRALSGRLSDKAWAPASDNLYEPDVLIISPPAFSLSRVAYIRPIWTGVPSISQRTAPALRDTGDNAASSASARRNSAGILRASAHPTLLQTACSTWSFLNSKGQPHLLQCRGDPTFNAPGGAVEVAGQRLSL